MKRQQLISRIREGDIKFVRALADDLDRDVSGVSRDLNLLFEADTSSSIPTTNAKSPTSSTTLSSPNLSRSDLRTRANAVRETRDTVTKLSEASFEDCHRIRVCEGCRLTVRCWPRFVVNLEMAWAELLVGFVLMPAT